MALFLNYRIKRGFALALSGSFTALLAVNTLGQVKIYEQNFDSLANPAALLTDTVDADPGVASIVVTDDDPMGGIAGSGIQLINWLAHSEKQSLLVRSGSEAIVQLFEPRSGSQYQFDFWLYTAKGDGDRNFYVIVRGEGSDNNGEDFLAYRSDRAATKSIFYYDGVGEAGWRDTGAVHADQTWQHHRMVFDMANLTFDLFIDNMDTPVVDNGDISRTGAPVPTAIILRHEGNSADDGYYAIDDISLTVTGSKDITQAFKDGFEGYAAASSGSTDDADPSGPWITVEADGTGDAKFVNPAKVQVVDQSVTAPHGGSRCLKIEGGQRAGVSYAWGATPEQDVEVTWWAMVPASVKGLQANYLRFSLYGAEAGRADQGDSALMGYGSRDGSIGDETSLTLYTTAWVDSKVDYTPDKWEEYRLTTHNTNGTYSIVKNPSSGNPVTIADQMPYIGTAKSWGPMFMAAWSSSNGSGHPPVYIDDIEVKAVTTVVVARTNSYTASMPGARYSEVATINLGATVGAVAVDPRDNKTIIVALDDVPGSGGGIYRAQKTGAGVWTVDTTPIVSSLDRPSDVKIDSQGTLWWVHDYEEQLARLKYPWASNKVEVLIEEFGQLGDFDDDPISLTIAPAAFSGSLGKAGDIIIADRGSDGDVNNAVYVFDPASTATGLLEYQKFLVAPSDVTLSGGNLNSITALQQSGEVVTVSEDGFIVAINGEGVTRPLIPSQLYTDPAAALEPEAIAVDPTTGRLWIADDVLNEIWSIGANPGQTAADKLEIKFRLLPDIADDAQIDFHDPGMAFAPNGSFLVVADANVRNGGGRLVIFHNEKPGAIKEFKVLKVYRDTQGVHLEWESAGAATYRVLRGIDLQNPGSFTEISGDLTATQYIDAAPLSDRAFYRIIARP